MEKIEAKNGLEGYLYNSRNSFRDEKVKEKLDADTISKAEEILKEHIEWLESHSDETTEVYKERQKVAEDAIRPMLMKLYGATDASGEKGDDSVPSEPKVEEVD